MGQSDDLQALTAREMADRMNEILDNMTDAFYAVDHEWRLTYINRKTEEIWNYSKEYCLGKSIWEIFSPVLSDDPKLNEVARNNRMMQERAMATRTPAYWETISPDGRQWAEMSAYPIQDGLAVFFRDITEKKLAEAILRASQERQEIMLRLSDSLRSLDNPDDIQEAAASIIGTYLGVNTAFYCDVVEMGGVEYFNVNRVYTDLDKSTLLGIHPIDSPGVLASENYAGRNVIVCDMETDPRIGDALRPSLRERRLGAWVAIPLIRNGRYLASFTVQQAQPRNWTQEEIALIEETTARTWAEVDRVRAEIALRESQQQALRLVAELENADRNKNAFLNALSHELRNPLAAIVASISMLDILDNNPEIRKPKEIIKRQAEQLSHLVDDLLDLTRITNNKIRLNLEPVELNAMVQASAYDHRTLFADKGVALETEICAEPLHVIADPVRIAQVFDNLLHNACKFTEKGGVTVMTTRREGGEAVVSIRDNGIGIDASFLPNLFQTFQQAGHHKGGLGLGLSIVKGIVGLHGGSVSAESGGLNMGSTFTVRLPLSKASTAVPSGARREAAAEAKPLKILLIDDNRDLVEMTGTYLTLLGFDVAFAHTGMGGIDKAKSFLPDVIICDIGLPDIDGYEVARRISAHEEFCGTCLISLSGYAQAGDFELSREAGYMKHISKPVDFENLKSILGAVERNSTGKS